LSALKSKSVHRLRRTRHVFRTGKRAAVKHGGVKKAGEFEISSKIYKALPHQIRAFIESYGKARRQSRRTGESVDLHVHVTPDDFSISTLATQFPALEQSTAAPTAQRRESEGALAEARERGQSLAAKILGGADMLSADQFAELLGTTRATVNTKRQNRQILGLEGATRGFRFPIWQIGKDGRPFSALPILFDRLGDAWAVYRFLVQQHSELDGMTGREALSRGIVEKAIEVAESVSRDFS
jgi:hypothetical protein